jgi:hypothetical protein
MHRLAVPLAAALLVLAGCSAVLPGPSEPTPEPTPVSGRLAPGVTAEGITNPIALQSAHQRRLLADGFVVGVTYENVAGGTVQQRSTQRVVAGPGGERARQHSTAGDAAVNRTVRDAWLNTTHTTTRSPGAAGPQYTVRERLTPPESLVWPGPVLRTVQDTAGAFEVTAVERRDGLRVVTLSATVDRAGPGDTTATLVVDERGVVRSLVATTNYGGAENWRLTYTLVRLGADPAPPPWLADVPPSAALQVALFTDMGPPGVVRLENVGRDPVPAGARVTLAGNGTLREARLPAAVPPGETLFVSVAADTGRLRLGTTEPERYDPVPATFTVRVVAPDGTVLHEERLGWR